MFERPGPGGKRGGSHRQKPGTADGGGLHESAGPPARAEPRRVHPLPGLAPGPGRHTEQPTITHPVSNPEPDPLTASSHAVVTKTDFQNC